MLTLVPPASGVWLATRPVDMRKSFDGLSALVEQHCQRNVLEGGLFVFVNKRRDRVKLIWWNAYTQHTQRATLLAYWRKTGSSGSVAQSKSQKPQRARLALKSPIAAV